MPKTLTPPYPVTHLANWIVATYPGSTITSLYRPDAITTSGYVSLHSSGRAVDIAASPTLMDKIFTDLLFHTDEHNLQELIHNHQLWSYGNGLQPWDASDHLDHVHVGIRESGGDLVLDDATIAQLNDILNAHLGAAVPPEPYEEGSAQYILRNRNYMEILEDAELVELFQTVKDIATRLDAIERRLP